MLTNSGRNQKVVERMGKSNVDISGAARQACNDHRNILSLFADHDSIANCHLSHVTKGRHDSTR